jgi:predicted cupin superfamily sugar epimerase
MKNAQYWIDKLELSPHVEGGYFKEIYRSSENISKHELPERFNEDRSFCTAIYFLLHHNDFSAFHRIKQDELWHFYIGHTLLIHVIDGEGNYSQIKLGKDLENGEVLQAMVPYGSWFAVNLQTPDSFALAGCTVSPGFDFNDLELAERHALVCLYPEHQEIIERLTR